MTEVVSGADIISDVISAVHGSAMVITDSNVARLYPQLTENAFVIPAGERSKNKDVLFDILSEMSHRNVRRGDAVTAVGGGVVGDITGLAAALYMRGIDFINVPTTLLSMVDSGIGGKTAVNHCGIKNLIGAFKPPLRTVISYAFLETLDDREWLCGTGELIKTCLLTENAFERLNLKLDGLIKHDRNDVYDLIETCIDIKSRVVRADPTELRLRKILNVGHTVAHALESINGDKFTHGEYVLKGMLTECAMFKDMIDPEYYARMIGIFKMFTDPPRTSSKFVCDVAAHDKKNVDNDIRLMIPTNKGEVSEISVTNDAFISRYESALKELKRV